MNIRIRSLGLIGLLGGVGGAITTFGLRMQYASADITIPIDAVTAALHGGLLAVTTVGLARLFWGRHPLIRWIGAPVTAFVSGWLCWAPVEFAIRGSFVEAVAWPFIGADIGNAMTVMEGQPGTYRLPYWSFGLVGVIYYVFLALFRQLNARRLTLQVAMACVSGTLGSVWYWSFWGPWAFCLIHGTIWGSLVGYGVWKSQQWVARVDKVHHL